MMFGPGAVTPAVKFLLIANTAVFVLQTVLGAAADYRLELYFGLVPPLVLREFYLWQLFTYQFLHGGLLHILFNMLAVWMFGCDLERRWGSNFFLRYYFITVVGGGILNTIFLPHQMGRRFGGRLRHSSRLRADLPQPHHLFLFALSDQDEALRLDHRRHRALFLDDRRPERHRAPGASRGHGLRLRLSARLSRVQPVGARQRLSR